MRRSMEIQYRGLTWDAVKQEYKWVYGLPSYGFETDEISEIGTPNGDFYEINPTTLGKRTKYKDRHGKSMYVGDITILEVDGELREFEVIEATLDREFHVLPGFKGDVVKVRLSDVIAFQWIAKDGKVFHLLPCVNKVGINDTESMQIIDTVAERCLKKCNGKI